MKLPKHHQLMIWHNEHHANYESVSRYIENSDGRINISDEDKEECVKRNEIWEIQWYPTSPISFYCIGSYSLEKCLEKISESEDVRDYE